MANYNHKANICFNCKLACGGCPWTAVDERTGKVKFEPIPGWTAEPVKLYLGAAHGRKMYGDTFRITACPMFKEDRWR